MSNSPTLPPRGNQRKPTPLPDRPGAESDACLASALAAGARADASLTGLSRAIQQLGNGLGGAREANETLTLELEGLRDMLALASEQQLVFERQVAQLQSTLDRTRSEHEQERRYLIEQQDAFLIKLLDEQEGALKRRDRDLEILRDRLAELERRNVVSQPPPFASLFNEPSHRVPPEVGSPLPARTDPPASDLERTEHEELQRTAQKLADDRERARETVARLRAQRDDAQNTVVRITKERDDALQQIYRLKSELGGPRIPLSTRPPPSDATRDSGAGLSLDRLHLERPLNCPTTPFPPNSSASQPALAEESGERAPRISSVLNPPPGDPLGLPLASRLSPPPARLSPTPPPLSPLPSASPRAPTPAPSIPSSPDSRAPLKQKPDPSTRPLVGYSMGNESVEAEHLEGVRLSSRPVPPGSGKR